MEAEAEAESIRVSDQPSLRPIFKTKLFVLYVICVSKLHQSDIVFVCELTYELNINYSDQVRGEAEAYAVEAKGRAEAEQMAKKAEAFQQYQEGAMVDMLLEKLPLVR